MLNTIPENKTDIMIHEIKNNPVYLYGGGCVTEKALDLLSLLKVTASGVLIDRQYLNPDKKEICGVPIFPFEDFIKQNKKAVIIAAFRNFNNSILDKNGFNNYTNLKLYAFDIYGTYRQIFTGRNIDKEFYLNNFDRIKRFEELLEDEKSVEHFEAFLYQCIGSTFTKIWEGNQYFPSDIITYTKNEVFVDCGVYHGETSLEFIQKLSENGITLFDAIYGFEPDPKNAKIARSNLNKYREKIHIVEAGTWKSKSLLKFSSGDEMCSCISEDGDIEIPVDSIDNILQGEKATFIKMDIQGSELEALKGAEQTIRKYKPKLAICIYHKPEDITDIPEYIHSLNPEYKFYVRNHLFQSSETVLYAV